MTPYSIAIDGPSGAGKSTLAKRLAARLGILYVDTGAIYRTVGLFVTRQGGDCAQPEQVISKLPALALSMHTDEDGLQHMTMNGEDVTQAIRKNEVSRYASLVSAIPSVRAFLLDMQRDLAKKQSVVMDGRDIGTVVLPNAEVKIFLTASAEKRAERRCRELEEKGERVPFSEVLSQMLARDHADATRSVAPLKKAEAAIELDTSDLSLEESVEALYTIVKENIKL